MARPRKLKKIQFLDQRPNRKIRRVEVHLRETVLSHEAITVSVRDRRTGNAVHGCEVEMLTLEGVRVAAAPTQSNGEAVFGAPCVDNPTTFEFLLKSGTHTSYVDDAPGFAGGLQPLHLCTVLSDIALVSASTVTRDPHQFEIDQGFSWWGSYGFPELGAKLQRRRRRLGSSTDADKSEIENHIRHKGPGDVYVFLGHTFANATGATAGLCSGDDELVTPDDLKAAAGKRGLPGIVFLAGCSSEALLQPLVDACAKLACGFSERIMSGRAAQAIIAFFEALLDGKTLGDAKAAAGGVEPSFRAVSKPPINDGMTYDEILDAPPQPDS